MVFGLSAAEIHEKKTFAMCNWKTKQKFSIFRCDMSVCWCTFIWWPNFIFGQPLECAIIRGTAIEVKEPKTNAFGRAHTYIHYRTFWSTDLSWLTANNWVRIYSSHRLLCLNNKVCQIFEAAHICVFVYSLYVQQWANPYIQHSRCEVVCRALSLYLSIVYWFICTCMCMIVWVQKY